MDSGYNYSTYTSWDVWVPVGVSLVTIVVTTLVVVTSLVWLKFYRSSAHHLIELTYHIAKLTLGESLQRNLRAEPPTLTLYDRRTSPAFVILLSSLTPAIFIPAFVSFWASFLVDETYACDPGLDCFLQNSSYFALEPQQLLTNCTDPDNDTIICFQFVFDFVAGCASMGGFVVVAVTSIKVYGIALVWLVGLMPSSRSDERGRCYSCRVLCSVLGVFVFFLSPLLIASVILIIALLQPLINDIIFQSNERILKFASYWLSLLFTGIVAGVCILAAVLKKHLNRESFSVHGMDRERGIEAGVTASFNMSATMPLQQPNKLVTTADTNLNSLYTTCRSSPEPITSSELDEPDFNPPKLVGSVLSSYHDLTSLPPRHSESSLLLTGGKLSDYQTT